MIGNTVSPLPAFLLHVGSVAIVAFFLGLFIRRRVFVVPIAFLLGSMAFFCARYLSFDFRTSWNDLFWEPVFRGKLLRRFPDWESYIGFVLHWLVPLGLAYWVAGWATLIASGRQSPDAPDA